MTVTVNTNYRIPLDLHDRLKSEAEARVVGVNLLVVNAIGFYLDSLPRLPSTPDSGSDA